MKRIFSIHGDAQGHVDNGFNLWVTSATSAGSPRGVPNALRTTSRASVMCATVMVEGQPRWHGEGPLTRKSFSRNDRSFG